VGVAFTFTYSPPKRIPMKGQEVLGIYLIFSLLNKNTFLGFVRFCYIFTFIEATEAMEVMLKSMRREE